jgi:hypothetical protein
MDNSTGMQELSHRDLLYYNAASLFFSNDIWLGINAIVNTIEFDSEHDHVCRFLDTCADYLTGELLKARMFDPESSKLEQLSEYEYGFTVLNTKHLYAGWEYVEDSYSSSRKWDDSHEYGDYKKFTDSIRVRYNIDFVIQDFVSIDIIIFADIEREGDTYKCIGATVSSSINITGNKAIVKLYGENMSKTLLSHFKKFINNEETFLCPVSTDGHLCFCRQLRVCCCR